MYDEKGLDEHGQYRGYREDKQQILARDAAGIPYWMDIEERQASENEIEIVWTDWHGNRLRGIKVPERFMHVRDDGSIYFSGTVEGTTEEPQQETWRDRPPLL